MRWLKTIWKYASSILLIAIILILFIPSWRLGFQTWFNGIFMGDLKFERSNENYPHVKDFAFFEEDDRMVNFYELKGKPTLVSFWRTWCGPCRAELPKLKEFEVEMGDKINLIGITSENFEVVHKANISTKEYSFIKYAPYPAEAFEVNAFPTLFLLDSNLEIIDKHEGIGNLLTNENIALINSLILGSEN